MRLDSASLLVPRIARRLRAVHVPAGVLPINHNLSVARPRGGMTLDDLREALTCAKAQTWVAETAPRLENGYLSISTRFLRELPVCGVQAPPMRAAAAA